MLQLLCTNHHPKKPIPSKAVLSINCLGCYGSGVSRSQNATLLRMQLYFYIWIPILEEQYLALRIPHISYNSQNISEFKTRSSWCICLAVRRATSKIVCKTSPEEKSKNTNDIISLELTINRNFKKHKFLHSILEYYYSVFHSTAINLRTLLIPSTKPLFLPSIPTILCYVWAITFK